MRFHVRRKFSTGKTKGFDIFNYLNYFWSQIRIVLSDGFFFSRNAVSGNFWSQILTVSSDGFFLSMKYNVFVLLSLFNKMSDLGPVVNKAFSFEF